MNFGPNPYYSRSILVRFVVGIVFIGMLVWWTFTPTAGQREFERSEQALKRVTSWREEVPPGASYEEHMEVSCANQSAHLVRQSHPANAAGITLLNEDTRIGSASYSRHSLRYEQDPAKDMDSDWQRGSYAISGNPCAAAAQGATLYSFPDFERLIRTAVISRGDKEYLHGIVCRNWKLQVIAGRYAGRPAEVQEVCIGVDDHLPYRYRRDGLSFLYYDWNGEVSIEEPTVIDHPRAVPWQQTWPSYGNSYSYRVQQPESGPPMRYISPTPPPLPGPEPPPLPDGQDDEPRG